MHPLVEMVHGRGNLRRRQSPVQPQVHKPPDSFANQPHHDAQEKSGWIARTDANRAQIKQLLANLSQQVSSQEGRDQLAQVESAQDAVEASYTQMQALARAAINPESDVLAKHYLEQSFVPANTGLLHSMQVLAQHGWRYCHARIAVKAIK